MIGPYQAPQYDPRPGARRLSELGMRQGDIEAQRAERVGSAWAGGIEGASRAIAGTMTDLAKYAEEEPAREARNSQLKAQKSQNEREVAYNEAMKKTGGMSPDEVIKALRDQGFHEKASTLQKELDKSREDQLDLSIKNLTVAEKNLGQAALLMDTVRNSTGAEAQTYASVLPKVRELVGEDLGKMLPEQYDPAFVEQATTWGMSMKDKMSVRKETAESLRQNLRETREGDKHFTEALSKWLGTTSSQEEWDEAIANAKGLGAPAGTIAKFGGEYSPEAVARAKAFAEKQDAGPKAGSFEAFMTSFAKSKGVTPDALTPADQLSGRRQWESAGWKPEKPTGGDNTTKLSAEDYKDMRAQIENEYKAQLASTPGSDDTLSMEARNTAMRWRSTQLEQLDKAARASGLNPSKLTKSMSSLADTPEGWHPPMAPGRVPAPPMQGPPASAAPTRPPVNFRQPPPAPTSSQQPTPVQVRLPNGKMQTFPSQEAADAFIRAASGAR